MARADKHRVAMQAALSEVRTRLVKLLGYEETDVLYQSSDGWVILFGEESYNAKLTFSELDEVLCMNRADAIEFLFSKLI